MSRVGISTACYYPQDTFLSFLEVLGTEVPVAEVFMNSLAELDKQNLQRYRDEMKAREVEIISFHPYTSAFESLLFFSEYQLRRHDGIELYKRFFDAAQFLGAKIFVFHGEKAIPTFSRDLSDDEAIFSTYSELIENAKNFGLTFTQENVNNHRSQSVEYIKKLSALVPELKFTFDLKQALRAHQNYGEMIDAMGDKLCHIHINDYGKKECCLPFDGDVDLYDVKDRLSGIGYCGDYILEVYRACFDTTQSLVKSLEKTRKLFCEQ